MIPGDWLVLGVDPAPRKQTVAFDGEQFITWQAEEVRDRLHDLVTAARSAGRPVLVLWDAPLCMDVGNFYGRRVDKDAASVVKRWMQAHVVGGMSKDEKRAVGVAAAAQCPHNILSMHVLGMPMGTPTLGLSLLTDPKALLADGAWVAEVHPAVAMGAFYSLLPRPQKLLRYKKSRETSRSTLETLLTHVGCIGEVVSAKTARVVRGHADFGDDELDAFVAWVLGVMLLRKQAVLWRGLAPEPAVTRGYYVMPRAAVDAMSVG